MTSGISRIALAEQDWSATGELPKTTGDTTSINVQFTMEAEPVTCKVTCLYHMYNRAHAGTEKVSVFHIQPTTDGIKPFILKTQSGRDRDILRLKTEMQWTQALHPEWVIAWIRIKFNTDSKRVRFLKLPDMRPNWHDLGVTLSTTLTRLDFWSMMITVILDVMRVHHVLKAVHLDVKGGNFFTGPLGFPRLMDLGCCQLLSSEITPGGTLCYAAPETFKEDAMIDNTCDFYSLGITLLQWLLIADVTSSRLETLLYPRADEDTQTKLDTLVSQVTISNLREPFEFLEHHPTDLICLRQIIHGFLRVHAAERLNGEGALWHIFSMLPGLKGNLGFLTRAQKAFRPLGTETTSTDIRGTLSTLAHNDDNRLSLHTERKYQVQIKQQNCFYRLLCLDRPHHALRTGPAHWYPKKRYFWLAFVFSTIISTLAMLVMILEQHRWNAADAWTKSVKSTFHCSDLGAQAISWALFESLLLMPLLMLCCTDRKRIPCRRRPMSWLGFPDSDVVIDLQGAIARPEGFVKAVVKPEDYEREDEDDDERKDIPRALNAGGSAGPAGTTASGACAICVGPRGAADGLLPFEPSTARGSDSRGDSAAVPLLGWHK